MRENGRPSEIERLESDIDQLLAEMDSPHTREQLLTVTIKPHWAARRVNWKHHPSTSHVRFQARKVAALRQLRLSLRGHTIKLESRDIPLGNDLDNILILKQPVEPDTNTLLVVESENIQSANAPISIYYLLRIFVIFSLLLFVRTLFPTVYAPVINIAMSIQLHRTVYMRTVLVYSSLDSLLDMSVFLLLVREDKATGIQTQASDKYSTT